MTGTHEQSQCTQNESSNSKAHVRIDNWLLFQEDMSSHDHEGSQVIFLSFCQKSDGGNVCFYRYMRGIMGLLSLEDLLCG